MLYKLFSRYKLYVCKLLLFTKYDNEILLINKLLMFREILPPSHSQCIESDDVELGYLRYLGSRMEEIQISWYTKNVTTVLHNSTPKVCPQGVFSVTHRKALMFLWTFGALQFIDYVFAYSKLFKKLSLNKLTVKRTCLNWICITSASSYNPRSEMYVKP
jgi:hypothetical protein